MVMSKKNPAQEVAGETRKGVCSYGIHGLDQDWMESFGLDFLCKQR